MKKFSGVILAAVLAAGCTGQKEVTTISASGIEASTVVGPNGETCSQTSKNLNYKGQVLVVAVRRGGDGPTITLTPASAGLGGGSWSSGDEQMLFNWTDEGLELELMRDAVSVGKARTSVGLSTVVLGGEAFEIEAKVETMGQSANDTDTHAKAKIKPMLIPNCDCSAIGCAQCNCVN